MEDNMQNQQMPVEVNNVPSISKPSRWIGIIAIALFIILGGLSGCPWYMWIVLIVLALLTFGGMMKWSQLVLGVVLLIWGIPSSNERSDSGSSQFYQTESNSSSSNQSDREREIIEGKIELLQSLKSQFDRADRMGAPDYELKRISDEAWAIKQSLESMNLTHEQRVRISNMFAL